MICCLLFGLLFHKHVLHDLKDAAQHGICLGFLSFKELEDILAGLAVRGAIELEELLLGGGDLNATGLGGGRGLLLRRRLL